MTRKTEVFEIGDFKSKVMNKVVSVRYEKQNYSRKYSPKGWNIIFYDKQSVWCSFASISIKDERLKFHMSQLRGAEKHFTTHIGYRSRYWYHSMLVLTEEDIRDFIAEFKRAYKNKQLKPIV